MIDSEKRQLKLKLISTGFNRKNNLQTYYRYLDKKLYKNANHKSDFYPTTEYKKIFIYKSQGRNKEQTIRGLNNL